MNNRYVFLAGLFATIISLLSPATAEAVPAFARQMGASCDTCHFQHFPMLNSFGRAFKASGFTMATTPLIESEHFSIPESLDAAVFTNIRYQMSNGTKAAGTSPATSNDGQWIIPAETSLFVAGRASENVGVLMEGDVGGAGADAGAGFLASLKLPIVFPVTGTMNIGVVPFTSGLGPAYAFEVLNTGAVGNHVMTLVHPTEVSEQQYIQVGGGTTYNDYAGDAEGIGFFAATSSYFFTAASWQPNHISLNSADHATAKSTSTYLRAAMTPHIGGWDIGVGVQYFGGESAIAGTTLDPVRTKAVAFDAQAQGIINQMPLGVYFSYASAPGTVAGDMPNLYDPNPNRKWAASLAAEWAAYAKGRGTLQLAYRRAEDGAAMDSKDDALTVGASYLIAQNIQLSALYTKYIGRAHDPNNPAPLPMGGGATGSGNRLLSMNLAIGF